MGYDITFQDNRKEWYNIWHMELFSLFHAYALRKLEIKEFKKRVFALGLEKNQAQGHNDPEIDDGWEGISRDKESGKPIPKATFYYEKIPISEFDIMKHLLKGKDIGGFVYVVRIEPASAIKDFFSDESGELIPQIEQLMLPALGHYERMEEYRRMINCPIFSKYSINDGHKITSKEAQELMGPFMIMVQTSTKKESDMIMTPTKEVFDESEIFSVIGMFAHLAYSVGSGYSFIVT